MVSRFAGTRGSRERSRAQRTPSSSSAVEWSDVFAISKAPLISRPTWFLGQLYVPRGSTHTHTACDVTWRNKRNLASYVWCNNRNYCLLTSNFDAQLERRIIRVPTVLVIHCQCVPQHKWAADWDVATFEGFVLRCDKFLLLDRKLFVQFLHFEAL